MAAALPLRWVCGLYRSVLIGFECQVWLSAFNTLSTTVRFALSLSYLAFVSTSVTGFFWMQLAASVFEVAALGYFAHTLIPRAHHSERRLTVRTGSRLWRLSALLGLTATLSILVTQSDKLILSKALPLGEYGRVSFVATLATVVTLLSAPITQAMQPRLTFLFISGENDASLELYHRATQALCVIVVPVALALALFAKQSIYAWTGNPDLATDMAPILALYALGNGLMAVAGMPYFLLYAKGEPLLDTLGMSILATLLIPSMLIAVRHYGAIGAAASWMCAMALYLIVWSPLVHHRCAPGLHRLWLLKDVGAVVTPGAIVLFLTSRLDVWNGNRLTTACLITVFTLTAGIASAMASPALRHLIADAFQSARKPRRCS